MIKNENTRGGALDGEGGTLAGGRRAGGRAARRPGREVWLAGTSRALAGESGALGRC